MIITAEGTTGGVMIKTGKHNIHAALMELNVRNVL